MFLKMSGTSQLVLWMTACRASICCLAPPQQKQRAPWGVEPKLGSRLAQGRLDQPQVPILWLAEQVLSQLGPGGPAVEGQHSGTSWDLVFHQDHLLFPPAYY